MPDNEIERLTVTLEADYKDFLKQIDRAVEEAARKLKETEQAPQRQQTAWERLGGFLKGQFLGIIASIGAAIAVAFSVQAVTQFFSTIARGMIDTNKQFEVFETQFVTLLGSTSEARKRIDELAQFGVDTPFELDEIVTANRLLQTFGGTLLATGENLRRVGDSAAGVNANFQEVSFWTGRLYAAIQSGRPFGEASARLQELGILTGDVRAKMEDMQKAGADGTEIWAAYSEMVDTRFAGAMDKLSKTLQGVMSNLSDFQSMLLREGGEELFAGIRDDAIEFYDIISNPEAQEALIELAKSLGSVLNVLRDVVTTPFLEQLKDVDPDKVSRLADALDGAARAFSNFQGDGAGGSNQALNNTLDVLSELIDIVTVLNNLLAILEQKTGAVSAAMNESVKIVSPLADSIRQMYEDYEKLDTVITALTGKSLAELTGSMADLSSEAAGVEMPIRNATSSLDAMGFAAEGVAENMRGAAVATQEAAEDFTKAREMFEGISKSFIDAQEEIGEKRAELEQEHGERINEIIEENGEKVAEIEAETAKKREEIVKDAGAELAELEQETAERREEIAQETAEALAELEQDIAKKKSEAMADAQEALSKLESDTQQQLSDVKEEGQEKERRETEDHQREMARLQQQYLLNLEDAVKNRDARAIADLRRKHQAEMAEREQDFQVKQSRDREDTQKRIEEIKEAEAERKQELKDSLEEQLRDIEENEAEKRDEIERSQEEQLQKLLESEEERRAAIEANREEELAKLEETEAEKLAKLEESLIEQLNKEDENYQERQQLLDEALERKLEAVAKQLADEKEITEAGAEAILETLSETYGEGGSIDQLMNEFMERRKAQAEALAALEENLTSSPLAGGGSDPLVGGGGAGNTPLQLPTFDTGGIVPGPPGKAQKAIIHGGELIVPYDQVSKHLAGMRDSMAMNFDGQQEVNVNVRVSGDAPPGIGGSEIEVMAGAMVQAFRDAGINARKK